MNKEMIKLLAMCTMLLNHIAAVFLESETFLYEILTIIGYFTAITMCFFIVEGYRYTRSKKKYAFRLLLFGVISQIPFHLALERGGETDFPHFNMMFTLFICFLIICARKLIPNQDLGSNIAIGLTILTVLCDWAIFAPVFTQLFLWAEGSVKRQKQAYSFAAFGFGLYIFLTGIGKFSPINNLFYALLAAGVIGVSAYCVLYCYNGKRSKRGRHFFRWFFYLFYPVHLFILGILRFAH